MPSLCDRTESPKAFRAWKVLDLAANWVIQNQHIYSKVKICTA
ncbi:hypothetical protein [Anabaena sp. 4-3]|nr:hypothetical protein [Anabaena sp. 4-3]